MNHMEKNKNTLIARFLSGEASESEIIELKEWLRASNDNELLYRQLKNIWDISENNLEEKMIDINKAYVRIYERVTFKSPVEKFWYHWKRIAAVLLIPMLLGNIFYFIVHKSSTVEQRQPVYNELYAAFGTRSAIKLPDGSAVWLNSGSSLRYPDRFTGSIRTVFLKGEAYFEVESDLNKPFIVGTQSLQVKATGTKFNVSGYVSDEEEKVALLSGKVEVILTDPKNKTKSSILDKNQQFSFNKVNGTTTVTNEDTYKYTSWKDGKLIFRNDPLSKVVKKIGQVFNIDIEIKGKEIENYSYRATFQDESLTEILKLLKLSSPIDYIEVKREPLSDGSFPRKRIIIIPSGKKRT
jgi:transmembrane sensor